MLSKAFLKSKNTAIAQGDLSNTRFNLSLNRQFADLVDWKARNPNCMGCRVALSRCFIIDLTIHFSATLDITGRMLMGL